MNPAYAIRDTSSVFSPSLLFFKDLIQKNLALVVRMPELGDMKRGQAAALIGVAPFDRDSGQFRGQRHILGGRCRPRRLLYIAALSAKRWNPTLLKI